MATLRPVTPAGLKEDFPPASSIDGVYGFKQSGGKSILTSQKPSYAETPLQYALGAGKSGLTFVTAMEDGTLLEAHLSYFPSLRRWYPNPGQPADIHGELGMTKYASQGNRCIGCHSTTLPEMSLTPEPKFYGVGCESCHGPGSVHIAAARAGEKGSLHMERLSEIEPGKLNEMCGRCHRTGKDITNQKETTYTYRFQAYAIMKSACFTKSGGALSCLSCHDPHTDASKDVKFYEAACLSCHSTNAAPPPANQASGKHVVKAHACPVNPASGCVSCHMPPRKAFKNTNIPTRMADHYIAIYRDVKQPAL